MTDYVHKTEFPGFYSRFKVGDKVKFRDPEFEDDKVHTVKKVDVETLNGHPWKIRIELENGVRRYDDHFILANSRSRNAVVQKALNATARNEYQFKDMSGKIIRTGDKVEWFDKIYTIKALSGVGGRPYDDATLEDIGGRTFVKPTHELRLVNDSKTSVLRETAVNANSSRVFKPGEEVRWEYIDGDGDYGVVVADKGSYVEVRLRDGRIEKPSKMLITSNASRSTNAVVAKALNAVARNVRAIPVDSKGKGIIERCKIRTTDGEVGEVAHIDEDGFVYFEAKDGRIRGVPADTVVRLNADTSVLRETAVNGSSSPWGFFVGEEVVIKRDPEKKKHRIKAIVGGDIILEGVGPRFDASELDTANYAGQYRTTNAVVAKAMNASRVARNERVDEATGRRDIEQSLRKMAELAARVSHAKATSKATHDDYSFSGYIDLAFPDKGAADNFNPYDVIYALRDARSLVPKWAWGVGGFNYERKGNLWRIHIGRFAT